MTKSPLDILADINQAIPLDHRKNITILIQYEYTTAHEDIMATLSQITKHGYQPGIATGLPTPIEIIPPLLFQKTPEILKIATPIGFSSQIFQSKAIEKLYQVTKIYSQVTISIDGGICPDT